MSNKPLLWLLCLTLAFVLGVGWQVSKLSTILISVADFRQKEPEMTSVSWKSGGSTVTHTGSPKAGETFAEFAARFRAEVDVLKTQFPEDP